MQAFIQTLARGMRVSFWTSAKLPRGRDSLTAGKPDLVPPGLAGLGIAACQRQEVLEEDGAK